MFRQQAGFAGDPMAQLHDREVHVPTARDIQVGPRIGVGGAAIFSPAALCEDQPGGSGPLVINPVPGRTGLKASRYGHGCRRRKSGCQAPVRSDRPYGRARNCRHGPAIPRTFFHPATAPLFDEARHGRDRHPRAISSLRGGNIVNKANDNRAVYDYSAAKENIL